MTRRLDQTFFSAPALDVARALLGARLMRRLDSGALLEGRIIETEAYCGPDDRACHASRGRTARTEVMFGPPGHWYVYLIYGMYHCLNIVTDAEGHPAAVLLRGIAPLRGLHQDVKTDGPGKLCRALDIDKSLNTTPAFTEDARLWIEPGDVPPPEEITQTPRIGVDYAGPWRNKPWRFVLGPDPQATTRRRRRVRAR